jgi:hypothetical protein
MYSLLLLYRLPGIPSNAVLEIGRLVVEYRYMRLAATNVCPPVLPSSTPRIRVI